MALVHLESEHVDAAAHDMNDHGRRSFASECSDDAMDTTENPKSSAVGVSQVSQVEISRDAEDAIAGLPPSPESTVPSHSPMVQGVPTEAVAKEKLQHVQILSLFLRAIPLREFELYGDSLTNDIRERWLDPILTNVQKTLTSHFMSTLSLATLLVNLDTRDTMGLSARCQPVVGICVDALMQCFDVRDVFEAICTVAKSVCYTGADTSGISSGISSKDHLIVLFDSFIDQVYDFVEHVLRRRHGVESVGALVDDVISLTFQEAAFAAARGPIMDVLRNAAGAQGFYLALFHTFVAQMNEIGFDLHSHRLNTERSLTVHPWSGRWLLDTQSVRTAASRVREYAPPTILQLVHGLHQLLCVDLSLGDGECSIRSVVAISTGLFGEAGMKLVLDGRSRVFGTLPNGLASIGTLGTDREWAWGDYAGQVAEDGRSLRVILFTFREKDDQEPDSRGSSARRAVHRVTVHVTSQPETQRTDRGDKMLRLPVSISMDSAAFSPEGDDLAEMPCSSRVGLFTQLEWTHVVTVDVVYKRVAT